MARLTKTDIEKLPEHTYIPCVYSFGAADIGKGYLYRSSGSAYLKHNDRRYEGLGTANIKGCKYSWKLYGDYSYLSSLTVLEINKNIGEL